MGSVVLHCSLPAAAVTAGATRSAVGQRGAARRDPALVDPHPGDIGHRFVGTVEHLQEPRELPRRILAVERLVARRAVDNEPRLPGVEIALEHRPRLGDDVARGTRDQLDGG
jgi:hypothetical protein